MRNAILLGERRRAVTASATIRGRVAVDAARLFGFEVRA